MFFFLSNYRIKEKLHRCFMENSLLISFNSSLTFTLRCLNKYRQLFQTEYANWVISEHVSMCACMYGCMYVHMCVCESLHFLILVSACRSCETQRDTRNKVISIFHATASGKCWVVENADILLVGKVLSVHTYTYIYALCCHKQLISHINQCNFRLQMHLQPLI